MLTKKQLTAVNLLSVWTVRGDLEILISNRSHGVGISGGFSISPVNMDIKRIRKIFEDFILSGTIATFYADNL